MDWHASTAVGAAIFGWLAGWWVPALIRMVPEPDSALAGEGDAVKQTYVDIAARRGLAWQSAIGSGLVAGLLGASVGWPVALVLAPLVPVSVALGIIDWHTRLLPRVIVLPATAYLLTAASLLSLLTQESTDLIRGLLGLVFARSLFWLMWRIHAAGMGFGDVRLAALVGFALGYLGWSELLIGLYAGFLLLAIPGLGYAVIKRDRSYLKVAVPFGPFMLVGAMIGILFGPTIAGYLGYA
jgi:leader peptidase (prepilin peptidase) / N-methyltransferase